MGELLGADEPLERASARLSRCIVHTPITHQRGCPVARFDFNDFNTQIMAEFHANAGKVGGRFEATDVLILTTTGARSGQTRWHPLVYTLDGDRFVIVASKGGA